MAEKKTKDSVSQQRSDSQSQNLQISKDTPPVGIGDNLNQTFAQWLVKRFTEDVSQVNRNQIVKLYILLLINFKDEENPAENTSEIIKNYERKINEEDLFESKTAWETNKMDEARHLSD